MKLNQELKRVLRLNTLESLIYHGILLGHQAALLHVVDYTLYGLIGTLFSVVYLAVSITNFGLDASLGAFFKKISTSKNDLRKTIAIQLIPQIIGFIFFTYAAINLAQFIPTHWQRILNCPRDIIVICTALIFFESLRKIARTVLQLGFMQRKTTLIEIGSIIGYTAAVWTTYFIVGHMNLYVVFMPMLAMSILSTSILYYQTFRWHLQLPENPHASWAISLDENIGFFKTRFFTFANHLSQTFFSSNTLVPLFALQFGLHHAGVFKFISTVAYSLTAVMHKIFGHTSDVLLSHAKDMSLEVRRSLFHDITNRLHQVLYGLIIFLAINIKKLVFIKGLDSHEVSWILVYLFFIINITENFLITYERFYITEEKSNYLFMMNGASLLGAYLILQATHFNSPLLTLLCVAVFRGAAFLCISAWSFYHWQIKPNWQPKPLYTLFSVITSVLFFLFVK